MIRVNIDCLSLEHIIVNNPLMTFMTIPEVHVSWAGVSEECVSMNTKIKPYSKESNYVMHTYMCSLIYSQFDLVYLAWTLTKYFFFLSLCAESCFGKSYSLLYFFFSGTNLQYNRNSGQGQWLIYPFKSPRPVLNYFRNTMHFQQGCKEFLLLCFIVFTLAWILKGGKIKPMG